jgi:transposase-like protein
MFFGVQFEVMDTMPTRTRGHQSGYPDETPARVVALAKQRKPNGKALFTYRQISEMLGVPTSTIRFWIVKASQQEEAQDVSQP